MNQKIADGFRESARWISEMGEFARWPQKEISSRVESMAKAIIDSFRHGGKLFIMGNGGSASQAQHMAAELVGRFGKEDRPALPALALTTDTSILTAVGNDMGFDSIFSRQIEALSGRKDIVLAISTSGNSKNLIQGIAAAYFKDVPTLALLGRDGGRIKDIVDFSIIVPAQETPKIQEVHLVILHAICAEIEERMAC